ncbi:MAG: penicillin acylase family protein [Chloroflexota bacterium]|nr:penicillin acylase family protein [Chloroflexota bacterium]
MSKRTLLSAIVGAVTAAAGATWYLLRKPVPSPSGVLQVQGLHEPVEVLTDRYGIPHIYAQNEHDLLWVQGFTMARERLFQMDFLRRFGAGRLSEVAGEETVDLDRWLRVLGLRRSAEKAWLHTSETSRQALLAFSDGVNAAMREVEARGALPIEFRLLGVAPERWTPVDSLSVSRILALALSVGWESDLLREGLRQLLGEERAETAVPLPPSAIPPISPLNLKELRKLVTGQGAGSNTWVVDGSRTESGLPLLANDLHLALHLPSIWFVQHLDSPTLKAAGLTAVGMPGIIVGHNEHAAWGTTAGYADVQDLYIEERVEMGDGKAAFRWGEMVLPATVLEERIHVRGRERPVPQRVIITRHGPLISDLLPDEPRDLSLRWSIEEPDDPIAAILAMNRAATWDAFRAALADHGAPPRIFCWAGRDGTTGWIMAGRIPIRQGIQGLVPLDGSTGENEWLGYIPLNELPQDIRPDSGYFVHANDRPVDESYPHYLGVDFFPGYRAARIRALVEGRATHDANSFRAIQMDVYAYPEHRLAQLVGELPVLTGSLHIAQRYFQEWDGRMTLDSVAATIAHYLFHNVRHRLVSGELASWTARWEGKVVEPELHSVLPHAFNSWAWVLARLDDPDHPWWSRGGTQRRESRDEILILALQQTLEELGKRWGNDPSRWTWGRVHQRTLEHPLGVIPLVGRAFNRGPFPLPGSAFSPNTDFSVVQRYQESAPIGAGARLIADVSDWDTYRLSLAGGNSGHPASPHYADLLPTWLDGDLVPLPWSRDAVEQAAAGTLRLLPA